MLLPGDLSSRSDLHQTETAMTPPGLRITRRKILLNAAATLICTPAIVRATSLMPVRVVPVQILTPELKTPKTLGEWHQRCFFNNLDNALNSGRPMTCSKPDGSVISVAEGQRIVADARALGWLA
jgi:hypothetical protein